jgi:anti-sigma factor ChrR (cupin superfamily)
VGIELARNINRRQARVAHMPFMSIDDPEFWKNCPKGLEIIPKSMEGTGGGVAYFVMGEPKDNAPTVVALRMAPNWVLPRHAHDCYRFEVVVQGTLDVGERILKVGDVISQPTCVDARSSIDGHIAQQR